MSKYFISNLLIILPFLCAAQKPQIIHSMQTTAGENTPLIYDMNDDGNMDLLVVSENSGDLDLWLGNGELDFVFEKTYAVGDNPTSLAVADFNEDGRSDLIVVNHERQYLSILFGESNGELSSAKQINVSVLPHPHVVATADVNSDGHMDVVIDSRDQSGLALLYGNGKGEFERSDKVISVNGLPYLGFALGDINGDEKVDVVTPNTQSISILSNTEKGRFIIKQSIRMPGVFAVELVDMNGDQNLDLIAASDQGAVHLFLGKGDGFFNDNAVGKIKLNDGAKLIRSGDFDGNGISDAVISNWKGGAHLLQFLDQKLSNYALDTGKIIAPWGLAGGDLNGNGKDEIVLTDGTGDFLNIYSYFE